MNQQQSNSSTPRKVAWALQGGGSHGAFTWGVLDRMLEDETIEIIGVTGTSRDASIKDSPLCLLNGGGGIVGSRHLPAILAHQPSFALGSHPDHAFCEQHRPSKY
jgi:hypothetical protein